MAKNRDEQLLTDFGNHIRKLRTDRGWSQSDLDGHSGIDRVQIERIENGKINTTIGTANQLALAFGLTMSELFDYEKS